MSDTDTTNDFDPADHTVDEVMEHVADHPEEAEAIFDKEKDGKSRVTLLEALQEGLEDDDEDAEEAEEAPPTPGVDNGVLAEEAAKVPNQEAEQAGLDAARQRDIDVMAQSGRESLDAQIAAKQAELDALTEARENAE